MDKYEQLRFVGGGMFGKAFLYEKKDDKVQYIIKKVNVATMDPDQRKVANREVEVLKQLHHPGIVKYIESFVDTGDLCIVMEYCECGDLHAKLKAQNGTPLDEDQIWDWFVQLCIAVKYLHANKIMHRDLKPNNIFITKDGTLKLGDFGLAKVSDCYSAMQHTFAGAFGFCAPEVLSGDDYGSKCDIWSLGCVLYCVVMLKPPFEATNPIRIVKLVASGEYDPVPSTYSVALSVMISKLLTQDPNERPSITQVLNDEHVKALANPQQRLRRVYGLQLNDGILQDSQGNGFVFDHYLNSLRDNKQRFEGLAEIFEAYVYDEMMKMGLVKLPVPLRPVVDPDYDSPGSFIFATENWQNCQKLMILIHGSGDVRAGQWTQRIMINESVEKGTQLPYIRRAIESEYGVIVLNTNDTRHDIEGCTSPVDHGEYVWRNYVSESEASHIAIKAHSAGGNITVKLLSKFEADFKKRVFANAFTGVSCLFGKPMQAYAHKVTRNWVTSKQNLGAVLPSDGCECVSAGTESHYETPHKAINEVFKFVALRFTDNTPGNL